ncbi:MAG: sigma-70 family RNA polymerase sigma factor [Flavobacteriales bacterium]|jgi:RNA polymerase sigma-70 factor (ECF subfamily)|nr:sigma-70 family RNA polymerase sigma factor [Flavobacteriales bacterium]
MSISKEGIDTSKWVEDYSDGLYNYAVMRVQDHDLALDFVQDTFVSALKALENFQGKSSVKTWLYSILKRKIIDHWRKQESRKTRPMSSYFSDSGMMKGKFLEGAQPTGRVSEVEKIIENDELREAIFGCISGLPDNWRGILVDKMIEEKKTEEVCKDHDITTSNLWVIIHRAKLQLRDCLDKKWIRQ